MMNAALRRQWMSQAQRWSWPGLVGAACLLLAALVAGIWGRSAQHALDAARIAADDAEHAAGLAATRARQPSQARSRETSFVAGFPAVDSRQQRVADLLTLAERHGLEVRRTEYRLSDDPRLPLLRYQLTMPLAGSYAELRAFIEEALQADGALALDSLRLRRGADSAATLDAELSWSLQMRRDTRDAVVVATAAGREGPAR